MPECWRLATQRALEQGPRQLVAEFARDVRPSAPAGRQRYEKLSRFPSDLVREIDLLMSAIERGEAQ